jgi:hypothetical protein
VVKALLEKIYGSVQQNYRLDLGTRPGDYANTSCHAALSKIYSDLQQHRGFTEFVRATALPPSDFYVPSPGFLVEFDESQRFTELRNLALSLYPSDLYFGFDLAAWLTRCQEIQARDNEPPHRDEQRAWYDTLRDFAPHAKGLLPTLRLHASGFTWCDTEHEWCSLDPDDATDVETFRHILGEWTNFWRLDYRISDGAQLARIAIDGAWRGNSVLARKLLTDISQNWPSGVHVHWLGRPERSATGKIWVHESCECLLFRKEGPRIRDEKDNIKRFLGVNRCQPAPGAFARPLSSTERGPSLAG